MSRTIAARVEDDTYSAVVNAANARGMSVNDWLKLCVEDHLNGKTERKQPSHDNPEVEPSTLANTELQRKWGCLIRGGRFTGSASEYEAYKADAAELAL